MFNYDYEEEGNYVGTGAGRIEPDEGYGGYPERNEEEELAAVLAYHAKVLSQIFNSK